MKVPHSSVSKFGKLSSDHRTGKCQFSSQSQRKAMPKNLHITIQLCSFHMLARLCSKSFKLGFNSKWTKNFQIYKLDLEMAEEREIKFPTSTGSQRKQENSRKKKSAFASLTMLKPLTVYITINCRKFLERWEYQITSPVSWETYNQVKKQQLESYMEELTGSKLEKEYDMAVYCHPVYLTYMQSTSWETLGWRKHKLESRLLGGISIKSDKQMTPPLWQKVRRN